MKKTVLIFILTIIFFDCTAKKELGIPLEYTEKGKYLWAFRQTVNIRKTNSTSSIKIGEIADGDSVFVTLNKNGWYKVISSDQKRGWIRSDLLGPRNLSTFIKAVPFIENLKGKDNIEIYFDKTLQHKCIYISYPKSFYKSKSKIEKKTRQLIRNYQNQVYRGDVTAHVIKPGSKDMYLILNIKGSLNPDPKLPILPFGHIEKVENTKPEKISLTILIPAEVNNNRLLETARKLTSAFPISYSQVQFTFYNNNSNKDICRLWYREDQNGEKYQFNKEINK